MTNGQEAGRGKAGEVHEKGIWICRNDYQQDRPRGPEHAMRLMTMSLQERDSGSQEGYCQWLYEASEVMNSPDCPGDQEEGGSQPW